MRLAELMEEEVVTLTPADTIAVARVLMDRHHIRHLPVLDGQSVIGIVSDRDVRPALLREIARDEQFFEVLPVERVMTTDVVTLGPNDTAREAANLMRSRKVDCIPVIDDHKLVGIVTASDLLELVSKTPKTSHPRPHTANDPRRQDRMKNKNTRY